jgi:glycosyltransferase involved in cell wall biosynthesis
MKIAVVIPALNEALAIGDVVRAVPGDGLHDIIVVDNGSTDDTARQATLAGARVIHEPRRGYGYACFAGADAGKASDIIVFIDGDRSDDPRQLHVVAEPVVTNRADLSIGSRIEGVIERGAMPLHAKLGNRLIVWLLHRLYGLSISDIGSFRAIRTEVLSDLKMEQMTYGWPVEMLVKAAQKKFRVQSVPITYRRRVGRSKVTGTVKGTMLAAYYMFLVPLRYLWKRRIE